MLVQQIFTATLLVAWLRKNGQFQFRFQPTYTDLNVISLLLVSSELYGEDDSIPGPPARLRHLLHGQNRAYGPADLYAEEEREYSSNSEDDDEGESDGYLRAREPWLQDSHDESGDEYAYE